VPFFGKICTRSLTEPECTLLQSGSVTESIMESLPLSGLLESYCMTWFVETFPLNEMSKSYVPKSASEPVSLMNAKNWSDNVCIFDHKNDQVWKKFWTVGGWQLSWTPLKGRVLHHPLPCHRRIPPHRQQVRFLVTWLKVLVPHHTPSLETVVVLMMSFRVIRKQLRAAAM